MPSLILLVDGARDTETYERIDDVRVGLRNFSVAATGIRSLMRDRNDRMLGEPERFVAEVLALARDRFGAGAGFADEREHSKFHKASVDVDVERFLI